MVRTGQPVLGSLDELDSRYPGFVAHQRETTTLALAALPVVSEGQAVGGVVLYFDEPQSFDATQREELAAKVAGLGPVPVDAVRALMPDAFIAAVVTKGRDVINVAHLGRGVNAHQRTAIEAIGLRCSNRACNQTIALQMDHRVEAGELMPFFGIEAPTVTIPATAYAIRFSRRRATAEVLAPSVVSALQVPWRRWKPTASIATV